MNNSITKELKELKIRECLARILYPRVCPVCNKLLTPVRIGDLEHVGVFKRIGNIKRINEENGQQHNTHDSITGKFVNPFICDECYKELDFAYGRSRCLRCSKPLDDESAVYCPDCVEKDRHFQSGIALMMHNDPARQMLYDLKYGNMRDNADFLSFEAAWRFHHLIGFWQPDVIIPVPLHRRREHTRGFNQAELLARKLSLFLQLYGLKIEVDDDYLFRQRQTLALKELDPEERSNDLKKAFAVHGARATYRSVLLVDDIFTTGATINECSRALRAAGVKDVFFFTASIGS